MSLYKQLLIPLLMFGSSVANSQQQMQFITSFDAGQQGVKIFKLFDPSDNVLCYILMPEVVSRKLVEQTSDKWLYEGNSIGSISCVKTRVHINVGGLENEIIGTRSNPKKK